MKKGTIEILNTGITSVKADAIVNAANEQLQMGGGVCGVIFRAAGAHRLQRACDEISGCDTGDAVITPGFDLCPYIIHAVGPRYYDGRHNEQELLYSTYVRSLDLAGNNACSSIVFPLISAGIFGYPAREAFETALGACRDWLDSNDSDIRIIFTVPEQEKYLLGLETAKKLGIELSQQL